MFWSDVSQSTIFMANLDGTDIQILVDTDILTPGD